MAKAPQTAPAPKPSLRARVGQIVSRLKGVPAWAYYNPVYTGLAGLALVAVIGCGIAWALSFRAHQKQASARLLVAALEHLDAGDYRAARDMAARLRSDKALAYSRLGTPLFVLGAVLAHEAEDHYSAPQRQMLFLVASRYLEESRIRGFPPGRDSQGLWLLGMSLHHSGQYAQSLPMLRAALPAAGPQASEIHRLLADSYLHLSPPKLNEALTHVRSFQAVAQHSPHDLDAGHLLEARILLAQGDAAAAHAAVVNVPENSSLFSERVLVEAEIAIQIAATAVGDAMDESTRARLMASLDSLRKIQERPQNNRQGPQDGESEEDAFEQLTPQAQLLIGRCYEAAGDRRAAVAQYDRVRRGYFGGPESLAATVYQADLLRADGNIKESVTLYERALAECGPRDSFSNPWLSAEAFESRTSRALHELTAGGHFESAVQVARRLTPFMSRVMALDAEARAQQAWGEQLMADAKNQSPTQAESTSAEARRHFREAGTAGRELADLRIATRFYLDDLSRAAENFRRGQNYAQAAIVYREILRQGQRLEEPDALIGLGESLLALQQTDEALATLALCRENSPKHPATYRARLLESQALIELGKLGPARDLLMDNLYNFSLTPQSSDWRDSLFTLGRLLYRQGMEDETRSRLAGVDRDDAASKQAGLKVLEQSHLSFQEAIRVLSEAVQRYPQAPQAVEARYRVAEAYRHSSKWPRKRLSVVTIETTRITLSRQVQEELHAALDEYGRLITELSDQQHTAHRTPAELAVLRNCYFGRADALFDLGRFEEAIQAYSAATNRYQHEPEVLEAYVQIASCYRRIDRPNEARGTIEQARVVVERIRPTADFTRTTRLDRQQWKDLLTWLRAL